MQPYLHAGPTYSHYLWNVSKTVGRLGANSDISDVSYIQFYYTLAANFALTPQERKAIYQKVKITGQCTGRDDDPLVQAIIAHQKGLKHPHIDGRVSVAYGSGKIGAVAFFVLRLGARFATMHPEQWPRLDKIPGCPAAVAAAAKASIPLVETTPP